MCLVSIEADPGDAMATPARFKSSQSGSKSILIPRKWPTLIALPVLLVTAYFGYYAAWGALFVFWGVTSTRSGQVYLVEPIDRQETPVLFWAISAMWIGFGVLYVLVDLFPSAAAY